MAKSKSTKRALLASMMSLVICCAMLIGTTLAWFTDSVTTGKNTIVAGNLDVELYSRQLKEGTTDEYKYVAVSAEQSLFDNTALWEPGHTEVVYLKVANLGSLALKYKLAVTVEDETWGTNVAGEPFKLSDYLVFGQAVGTSETVYATRADAQAAGSTTGLNDYSKESVLYPATSGQISEEYVALVVYMPETVGNEANYKTGTTAPEINLGISLYATQFEYETDSFGNNYDENAIYGESWDGTTVDTAWYSEEAASFKLSKPEELAGLASLVNAGTTFEGKTVTLTENISLGNKEWTPIGDRTHAFMGTFNGGGHTISDISMNRHWFENDTGLFNNILNAKVSDLKVDGLVKIVNYENSKDVGPGGSAVGGICAMASNSTIERCTNSIDFDMTGMSVGNWNYYNCFVGGICGFGGDSLTSAELTGTTLIKDCLNEGNFTAKARYDNLATVPLMGGITTTTDCKTIFVNNAINVGAFDIQDCNYSADDFRLFNGVVALRGCNNWDECMPWDGSEYTIIPEVHRRGTETWYSSTEIPYLDAYDEDALENPKNVVTSAEDMAKESTFEGFDFDTVWELTNGEYPTLRK